MAGSVAVSVLRSKPNSTMCAATWKEDLHSTLGMTINAGDATGMSAMVVTETAEGILLKQNVLARYMRPTSSIKTSGHL